MKKVSILFLIIFFWGCSNSKQMQIYNPYPEKEITLEKKNVSCSDTSEKKIWYGLYGSYQLNTLNMKDVFPSPDYSYKVEQISTSGDRIISVFTGLFFSISRKTLKIYSCKYSKPNSLDENNRDLIHSLKDAEITTLQEEVSSLKNKITEIETSIKVVPPIPKEENLEKKTGQIPSEDEPSISSKRENLSSESAIKDTPNYPPHSYILFRSNSAFLRKQERKKLANISDLLQKKTSTVLVVGYADKTGNFKSNLNLSWRRALAVKKSLIWLGLEKSRIKISAAGQTGNLRNGKMIKLSRKVELFLIDEKL